MEKKTPNAIKMTFAGLFKTILIADKYQSFKAARQVRKFLYSSRSNGKNEFKEIQKIIRNAPGEYTKISDDWRQENFVVAISVMYCLHDQEGKPDLLFPWLFQLLQHKNGNIRHAAVRMIEHELGLLTYHIRFSSERLEHSGLSPKQADRIIFGLRTGLNNLMASSWKDSYKKFKYINDLPSGTYKSAQLILSVLDDDCNEVNETTNYYH